MGKRGPKRSGPWQARSVALSTVITADVRDKLVGAAAAAKPKRTLSSEVELRLRLSFVAQDKLEAAWGNPRNRAILQMIADLIRSKVGESESWIDDPYNFDHVVYSINAVLQVLRPPTPPVSAAESAAIAATDRFIGDINAAALANDVLRADASLPMDPVPSAWDRVKNQLGPIADRLESLGESGMGRGERAWKKSAPADPKPPAVAGAGAPRTRRKK